MTEIIDLAKVRRAAAPDGPDYPGPAALSQAAELLEDWAAEVAAAAVAISGAVDPAAQQACIAAGLVRRLAVEIYVDEPEAQG